jgi:hypothetical protein
MDNREVLVKLQYTSKYGIQLSSTRVLKNYNLYKHLVLKYIIDKVYLDYNNEDCELVDLQILLNKAIITYDKQQIDSFNNVKNTLYKDTNTQYDLFTLIDNAYNDTFDHIVEKDLAFEKYTYLYKQLLDLSKNLMNKYLHYVGKDNFPKDTNELLLIELGKDRYNQLVDWMKEPIINDININCLINKFLQSLGYKFLSSKSITDVPLHKEALTRSNNVNLDNKPLKEKIIISKNASGLHTFKDLVFNMNTSLVIGKWNTKTTSVDKLSDDDINLCKFYNLKYDNTRTINTIEKKVNKLHLNNIKTDKVHDLNKLDILNENTKNNIENIKNKIQLKNEALFPQVVNMKTVQSVQKKNTQNTETSENENNENEDENNENYENENYENENESNENENNENESNESESNENENNQNNESESNGNESNGNESNGNESNGNESNESESNENESNENESNENESNENDEKENDENNQNNKNNERNESERNESERNESERNENENNIINDTSKNINKTSENIIHNVPQLNPYSNVIIPIVNEKVSRGRKKNNNVITGSVSLKQKSTSTTTRKTAK